MQQNARKAIKPTDKKENENEDLWGIESKRIDCAGNRRRADQQLD